MTLFDKECPGILWVNYCNCGKNAANDQEKLKNIIAGFYML